MSADRRSPLPKPPKLGVVAAIPAASHVPSADRAERQVLGAILMRPGALAEVRRAGLAADHFRSGARRAVYTAMLALMDGGKRPDDPLAIEAELRRAGVRDVDVVALVGLCDDVPTTALAEQHAWLVIDAARRRELLALSRRVAELVQTQEASDVAALVRDELERIGA